MIKLFNTMGRKLEEFRPLKEGEVKMYTCGPTVWNYPHIGNYRTFLFEDLLKRFLKHQSFKVTQVMNLTDVDDRIIKVCREQNLDIHDVTEKYTKAFFDDIDFLKLERAEVYPRATQHIPEMVKIIEVLLAKEFAYKSEDGSIYYKIASFPDYGKLSGLKISELKPGARVRQDDYDKSSAQDFAIWKAWDESDGNVFWETSLGKGRPGWHIECSAMSMKYLGEEFDIHTGGVDNIFPHHENEIAQSEAYTGKRFARYWLHAEHLQIADTKMSKRLGNIITIGDLKERGASGTTIRFALLSGHYRTQFNFTEKSLEQAASSLERINEFVERLREAFVHSKPRDGEGPSEASKLVSESRKEFLGALENDLDTPSALASVFSFISAGNKLLEKDNVSREDAREMLYFMTDDFDPIFALLETPSTRELSQEEVSLLKERKEARASKDWQRSDLLRKRLAELGVEVQDTSEGQKWRKKKPA